VISVSVRYETQFQQVQGKHIAPNCIGRAVSQWVDPLEDGGVL